MVRNVPQDAASTIIIGAGPAGRAAAEILPDAHIIARPAATAWHAEPGMVWIETNGCVQSVAFSRLLLCADEKLLLVSLDCAFRDGLPVVDTTGQTTQPGIFAAGRILGATTPEAAAA
jgi:thioredoxin reductase